VELKTIFVLGISNFDLMGLFLQGPDPEMCVDRSHRFNAVSSTQVVHHCRFAGQGLCVVNDGSQGFLRSEK